MEELKDNIWPDGLVNPKFLLGKTIYNFWMEDGYLILTVKEGWHKFKIKGTQVRIY